MSQQAQVPQDMKPVVVPEARGTYFQAQPSERHGWVTLAGVWFMVAGLWNFFGGWAALVRKEYFNSAGLLYQHLQAWGWAWLIIGALQVLTAFAILGRTQWGRWTGIVLAACSMLLWFFAIGAYPLWGLAVITLDAFILYGLCAHAEEFA